MLNVRYARDLSLKSLCSQYARLNVEGFIGAFISNMFTSALGAFRGVSTPLSIVTHVQAFIALERASFESLGPVEFIFIEYTRPFNPEGKILVEERDDNGTCFFFFSKAEFDPIQRRRATSEALKLLSDASRAKSVLLVTSKVLGTPWTITEYVLGVASKSG